MTRGQRRRHGQRRPWAGLAMVAVLACLLAGAGAIGWANGAVQAPAKTTTRAAPVAPVVTGNATVDALLARMSLADKLRLLDWADGGQPQTAVLPGIPALGIPSLHLTEGPLGTVAHPAPAMAAPLTVAATFSQADAYANGALLGRDARAFGQQAVARPFASIDPNPAAGRVVATFGEDPLLTGRTAAAEIAGIQAQGTMALVQNYLSSGTRLALGSAALHEFYLQPFQDAVRAGAAGLMCPARPLSILSGTGARPGPPGPAACGDAGLLTQILRRELAFGGFVVADQGANPGTTSLNAGLDGQIPGAGRAGYLTQGAIRAALANGTIGLATINQAAGAVLAEMDKFGMLGRVAGRVAGRGTAPESAGADERVVTRTAEDAATLLKDVGGTLPLSRHELRSLALIGPGAAQVVGVGPAGGNGTGIPSWHPGTLQVLRQDLAGHHAAHLSFAVGDDVTGTPVPASALTHTGLPGLVRATTGGGTKRVVTTLDNTVARGNPLPAGSAHTWTGELTAPVTGLYWVNVATGGARATLSLDGSVVSRDLPGPPGEGGAILPTTDGLNNLRAIVTLTAGSHTLAVSETPDGSGQPVQVRLDWVTPAQQQANTAAAVAAAQSARAAVVFAWSAGNGTTLPDGQDQLIQAVAAVNPRTIVVLNTPGPVGVPWLSSVKAALEMWYPGDAGGYATANVLLGRADPAGRLPVTWPAVQAQRPPANNQGVLVGYRWYDRYRVTPVFPFGYGLSYTHFRYSGLTWSDVPGGGLAVRFQVTNSGRVAGAEVPQVYLGAPGRRPAGAAFAPRALAAYTRITLGPGQTMAVTLQIPLRQLQYWDDAKGWVTAAGRRALDVGPSERAIALSTTVTIH